MDSTLHVHSVRITLSSSRERREGLLAYVRVALGPYKIDGIAVRRTLKGRLAISYPKRFARDGSAHPYFLPTDPAAREAFEKEVLDAYLEHQEGRP